MPQGHCSDEQLVAFLDGELPLDEWQEVSRHLDMCWNCRPRAAELEEQIHRIRHAFAEADLAVGTGGAETLDRLKRRMARGTAPSAAPIPPAHRRFPRLLLLAAASAALAATSLTTWLGVRGTRQASAILPPAPVIVRPTPPPAITASLPALPLPRAVEPAATHSPVPPLVEIPAPPPLNDLEVEVRFLIHRLGLDLGDPPRLRLVHGTVLVEGVAHDKLDELRAGLNEVSLADRVTLEPLRAVAATGPPNASAPIHVSPGHPPFHAELALRAGDRSRLLAAGNISVTLAERLMDFAWAQRRLERRYDAAARRLVSPRALWLVEAMERDYVAGMAEAARQLEAQLYFLTAGPTGAAAVPATTDSFASACAARDLVEWLFAGREIAAPPATVDDAAARLADNLDRLATPLQNLSGRLP